MTKHRWRKSLKSFLKSWVDSEKDEELRGTKAEIDGKVQNILNFLKEEDHNNRKEPLADLIEDFHHHYQSLYARYDRLTEWLRKKAHGKNGKDSSSSSSDSSDSDDTDVVNQELEEKLLEVADSSALEEAEKIKTERAKWSEEKSKLLTENADLRVELESERKLRDEVEGQINSNENKIGHMEKVLLSRGDEVLSLQKEMESLKNESSAKVVALTEKANSLEQQVELLQSEKSQLEEQIERFKQESSERLREIDAKNQEIDNLEETIEDLRRDLEMKVDEVSTLTEYMRTTEVKQRLSSQKLRITEQVLGDKENEHQKKVVKLLEEQKLLEERVAKLSGTIATYEKAQMKIVNEISEKVNNTLTGMDTFSMKFEEDYGHLESRIYEIGNELKVTVNWINANNVEKNEMKHEIASLIKQMKGDEDKIRGLEAILQKDGDEIKRLIQTVKQQEEEVGKLENVVHEKNEKMGEFIKKMNEKDNGMLSLGEEKREAIRQLCIWIDYHCNRYNDLKDMILKIRGGRQQVAS